MPEGSKLATGWLELTVSTAGAVKSITSEVVPAAEAAGDQAGKKMGGSFLGSAAKFAGPLVAAFGISAIVKTGLDEFKDASAGSAQLAAGIKSTGNAANVSVKGMEALASKVQGYSGQTDDSIVSTEQLLLTFKNIKNQGPDKIFDQATVAAANMAAKMGGDASSKAVLLGKALNDPVKGITSLTRVGVQFTDQQKEQIKAMVTAGDTAGAQKVILKELSGEFGGAAKAAGDSFPGQIEKMKRSFEDFSQTVVGAIVPTLVPIITSITDVFKQAGPALQKFGGFLKDNLNWILPLGGAILAIVVGLQLWAAASELVKIATAAWTVIQGIFNAVMDANPISLIVLAIVALVAAIIWVATQTTFFQDAWKAVSDFFVAMWTNIVSFFTTVWNAIVLVVTTYINIVVAIITAVVTTIVAIWTNTWNFISTVVSTVWGAIVGFVTTYINVVMSIIQAVGSTISAIWNGIWNGIVSFFTGAWNNIMGVVNTVGSAFGSAFSAVSGIVKGAFNGIVGVIKGAINSVIDLVNGAIGAINDTVGAAGAAFGVNLKIGKIPHLAKGGVVPATPGGRLAVVGEGRYDEAVVPLSPKNIAALSGGSGGGNVYIDKIVAPDQDPVVSGRILGSQFRARLAGEI